MIESIEIDNFKCIEHSGQIEIRPITLVMGPNSSGKSSILKPLLMMKQTADSRDIRRSLQVDGPSVELGSFREFVYVHDRDREVGLKVSFSTDRHLSWRTRAELLISKRKFRGSRLVKSIPESIELEVHLCVSASEQTVTKLARYSFVDESLGQFVVEKTRGLKGAYSGLVGRDDESLKFTPQRRAKFYDMTQSPRIVEYVALSRSELGNNLPRLLNYVTRSFEEVVSDIFYLGPLREEAAPVYGVSGERPQDVGKSGQDTPGVLWIGRSERRQVQLKKKVEKWLDEFEIAKRIKLHKLGPFFQVLLTDWHSGIECNITDVGCGASQLLPVIVAGYFAPEKSLLILEQPEIHLHPKAQTQLADLLIDVSRGNKKLLVETHSEHLLERIQTRIAQGVFDSHSVSLYYCEPTKEGTKIKRIEIDDFGRLGEDLPEGFFEESYRESNEHFKAIINRTANKKKKERPAE